MWKRVRVSSAAIALVCAAAAACGTSASVTYRTTSPQPLDATLRCVLVVTDSLGYKARLVNGSRGVEAIHNDSVTSQYEDARFERINASAIASTSNDGTSSLLVTAVTVSQHWTRIGLESDEVPASDRVRSDAQSVIGRCGGAS
jgi:hypothetical protein